VPELYPVLVAVANHVYVTPVDVLTLYGHEATPLVLVDRETQAVGTAPLTVMVTVAPETALPLLVTRTFSVTVEPFLTLAPLLGLISVTDNDFPPVTVNWAVAVSRVFPVTVTVYVPLAPEATLKDPDTNPADTVQVGLDESGRGGRNRATSIPRGEIRP
jgi:hypothetical protein